MRSIKNYFFSLIALFTLVQTSPSQDFTSNLQLQLQSPLSRSDFLDDQPGDGQENLRERKGELLQDFAHRKGLANWSNSRLSILSSWVVEKGEFYGFSTEVILAVISVESDFQIDAISSKGAMGLMQIRPDTAKEVFTFLPYNWTEDQILFNPLVNIDVALAYLRYLRVRMGNHTGHYLSAYNLGYAGMKRKLLSQRDYIAPYGIRVIQQAKKIKTQKQLSAGGI